MTYPTRCSRGGNARLWGYDAGDIADLFGWTRLHTRRLIRKGWVPDLRQVCETYARFLSAGQVEGKEP